MESKIKVIIFGKTYREANEKLDDILCCIDEDPIAIKRVPNNISSASFKLIEYKTVLLNKFARGHRADRIYIPRDIPLNLYRDICLPLLTNRLPKHDRIKYYN